MEGVTRHQKAPKDKCPHCEDGAGERVSMQCVKCAALLCYRHVTLVLASTSPFYKHRVDGRSCGPVRPLPWPA